MSATLPGERTVPGLVRDTLRAIAGLGRNTASMFAVEAREVARRTGRRMGLVIASAVVAGAGLVVLLVSAALLAEEALGLPRWGGLAILGAMALGAGAAGVAVASRRLVDPDLAFPRTIEELGKDADALSEREIVP